MDASNLSFTADYPNFPEFERYNIPLKRMDAEFILLLQELRKYSGVPMYPSPVHDAWARTSGITTSRHYAVERLSDAGDIFPERGRVIELFYRAMEFTRIGGIGIYADTIGPDGRPWPMLHFDMRSDSRRVLWARDKVYCTLGIDNKGYADIVKNILAMENGNNGAFRS